jgi:hypothetical protein
MRTRFGKNGTNELSLHLMVVVVMHRSILSTAIASRRNAESKSRSHVDRLDETFTRESVSRSSAVMIEAEHGQRSIAIQDSWHDRPL